MRKIIEKQKINLLIVCTILVLLNIYIYSTVTVSLKEQDILKIYFLNVGQGDSSLIVFPGNIKILVDAGPPNGKAVRELSKILNPLEKHIDLAIISHPQLDHMGGFPEILSRYSASAFLWNGEKPTSSVFLETMKILSDNKTKTIKITAGNRIRYRDNLIKIIYPPKVLVGRVKDLNESAIVMEILSQNIAALFTGDISAKEERKITPLLASTIDILKVAHHGSKYSSSDNFLKSIRPKISVIEVGKNSYGHPTKETLTRLSAIKSLVYRTDNDGTVKITSDGKTTKIYKIR